MARWENEDVSGLNLPDAEQVTTEYHDKNGNMSTEKTGVVKLSSITQDGKESKKYYIKFFRGDFIDPHSVDYNVKTGIFVFKKVNKKTYDEYMRYLKTKNRLYFTRSRRLYMEN